MQYLNANNNCLTHFIILELQTLAQIFLSRKLITNINKQKIKCNKIVVF